MLQPGTFYCVVVGRPHKSGQALTDSIDKKNYYWS